jgi:hypothetical protein
MLSAALDRSKSISWYSSASGCAECTSLNLRVIPSTVCCPAPIYFPHVDQLPLGRRRTQTAWMVERWKLRQLRTSLGAIRAAVDVGVFSGEGAGRGVAKQIDASQPTLRCVSRTERGEEVEQKTVIQPLARKALGPPPPCQKRCIPRLAVAGGRMRGYSQFVLMKRPSFENTPPRSMKLPCVPTDRSRGKSARVWRTDLLYLRKQ